MSEIVDWSGVSGISVLPPKHLRSTSQLGRTNLMTNTGDIVEVDFNLSEDADSIRVTASYGVYHSRGALIPKASFEEILKESIANRKSLGQTNSFKQVMSDEISDLARSMIMQSKPALAVGEDYVFGNAKGRIIQDGKVIAKFVGMSITPGTTQNLLMIHNLFGSHPTHEVHVKAEVEQVNMTIDIPKATLIVTSERCYSFTSFYANVIKTGVRLDNWPDDMGIKTVHLRQETSGPVLQRLSMILDDLALLDIMSDEKPATTESNMVVISVNRRLSQVKLRSEVGKPVSKGRNKNASKG